MTTTTTAATATFGLDPAGYDDDALDRLADLLAERLAVRLSGLAPGRAEPLVDAAEIARVHDKTRTWVYEHAGELGVVRLGSGPRPRLAFSPARVAERLEKVERPNHTASGGHSDPAPTPTRRSYCDRCAAAACALSRDVDRPPPERRRTRPGAGEAHQPPPVGRA